MLVDQIPQGGTRQIQEEAQLRTPTIYVSQFYSELCCIFPCVGPAPLRIVVSSVIGIAKATQLRCVSTQLDIGMGSAPKGARTKEPAQKR